MNKNILKKTSKKYCGLVLLTALFYVLISRAVLAEPLIDSIDKKMGKIEQLSGQFQQSKTIQQLPVPIVSNGNFSYQQSSGLIWETISPIYNKLSIPNQEESTRTELTNNSNHVTDITSQIFFGALVGSYDLLAEYFQINASGTLENWTISLIPHSESMAAYIEEITLSGKDNTDRIEIHEGNGDITKIALSPNDESN